MAVSEVDAIKTVDDALRDLADAAACERVLRWAWARYVPSAAPLGQPVLEAPPRALSIRAARKRKGGGGAKAPKAQGVARKAKSVSIVRDLNLKPKGKKSFADFVEEKQPESNFEKCTVAVYYLKNELDVAAVTTSHIFTCFKDAHWRVPPDLPNALALTAHRKGWLDTRDLENVDMTTHGENLIEHDLPRKKKA